MLSTRPDTESILDKQQLLRPDVCNVRSFCYSGSHLKNYHDAIQSKLSLNKKLPPKEQFSRDVSKDEIKAFLKGINIV